MKVKQLGDGVICYVARLNRNDTALPQALLNSTDTVSTHVIILSTVCDVNHTFSVKT